MDIDKIMTRFNPVIVRLLTSRWHGLLSRALLVLHVQGVRSGRRYDIPVGYQRQGNLLIILVSKSRRKQWWRNYRTAVTVQVTMAGRRQSGHASLVDKDSEMFKQWVVITFQRVPGLSKQFGISYSGHRALTAQEYVVVRQEAEMVLITL